MNERAWILMVFLFGVLAAGAVYLRSLAQRMTFQPPPQHAEEMARAKLSEAALQSTSPARSVSLPSAQLPSWDGWQFGSWQSTNPSASSSM